MSRPRPSCRCQPQPSWRRRRRRAAAISTTGEAPPPETSARSLCLRHQPRLAQDHNHAHPVSAPSQHRLCRLRPASTDPARRKAVLRETVLQETLAAPANLQVPSWAPPMSYHRPPASEAAKPSRAADEATKELVPAVRSTWVLP